MSGADERETLAKAICRWWEWNDDPEQAPCAACEAEADGLMPYLAERDRRVRAEVLRQVADDFPGPHAREEINNARDARRWLRERADWEEQGRG